MHCAITAGYKEIAITGVHLGSYGRDLHDGSSLARLVLTLAEIDDDVVFESALWSRWTAPMTSSRSSRHRGLRRISLPLQNGSDEMLRMMRRPYTVSFYARLVDRITRLMPHAAVGSDIIVGFPGEASRHFAEMLAALEKMPLTYLHVFPYRPAGHTCVAIASKVDGMEIRERARQVREIGERMTQRFRRSQWGRVTRALTVDDGKSAVTVNYLKLRLDVRTRGISGSMCALPRICGASLSRW